MGLYKPVVIPNFPEIPEGANFAEGSYVGTGTAGISAPCSLTFDFTPKIIFINGDFGNTSVLWGVSTFYMRPGTATSTITASYNGNTISWYSAANDDTTQLNDNNQIYNYLAIG